MMAVIFSLILSPQHSLSGIADGIRTMHIGDRLCLHDPESLNDFIVLPEFLNEVLQSFKWLIQVEHQMTKTSHESVQWDYGRHWFRVAEILLNQQLR